MVMTNSIQRGAEGTPLQSPFQPWSMPRLSHDKPALLPPLLAFDDTTHRSQHSTHVADFVAFDDTTGVYEHLLRPLIKLQPDLIEINISKADDLVDLSRLRVWTLKACNLASQFKKSVRSLDGLRPVAVSSARNMRRKSPALLAKLASSIPSGGGRFAGSMPEWHRGILGIFCPPGGRSMLRAQIVPSSKFTQGRQSDTLLTRNMAPQQSHRLVSILRMNSEPAPMLTSSDDMNTGAMPANSSCSACCTMSPSSASSWICEMNILFVIQDLLLAHAPFAASLDGLTAKTPLNC
jgi:hypothetical protein